MSDGEVLHLVSNVGFGGIANQAKLVGGELQSRGRCSAVVLCRPEEADAQTRGWYETRVSTLLPPWEDFDRRGLHRVREARRWFAGRPERILHFHAMSQEFQDWWYQVAARSAGKRVVVTAHHTVSWTQRRRLALAGQRAGWAVSDRMIVTTMAGADLVGQKVDPAKLRVVPCGVERPSTLDRSSSRSAWRFDEHELVIACVCRIGRKKGVFDLVEAFKKAHEVRSAIRLVIGGEGADLTALKSVVEGHPAIATPGRVDDVDTLYAASDLFVMPSYEEGFGLVYVEAAMHGVPSIAGDLPTVREVVLDGETGWLVKPGDVESLTQMLLEAEANRAELQRRGDAAKEYVKRFEISRVVDQLEQVYDELL